MEMQLEWWWWCTWKSTWNPATWLCRWKWDSSGLVLDLTGMIIHSFEGNQWKSYQQNSDSHKKCSESAILKTENRRRLKSFPTRCPKAIRLSSRSKRKNACCFWNAASRSCFSCKLLKRHINNLESGMPFLLVYELLLQLFSGIPLRIFKHL